MFRKIGDEEVMEKPAKTKEEFISEYCERSNISWEELSKTEVALPCDCGSDGCDGWAMVSNNEHSIQTHMDLYAPRT